MDLRKKATHSALRFDRCQALSLCLEKTTYLLPASVNALTQRPKHLIKSQNKPQLVVQKKHSVGDIEQFAYRQLFHEELFMMALAVFVSLIAVIQDHDLYHNGNVLTDSVNHLRILQVFLTCFSLCWVVRRYQALHIIEVLKERVSTQSTLWTSPALKRCIFELLLFSVTTIPYYEYVFSVDMLGFTIEYSLNSLLTFLTMLRLYTLTRIFSYVGPYTNHRATRICFNNGESANLKFALKCMMSEHPTMAALTMCVSFSLLAGYCLYLNERPDRTSVVDGELVISPSLVPSYLESLWLVFVSSTTVGYGDTYPTTHLGRFIIIIVAIVGNMYFGVVAVGLASKTQHTNSEKLGFRSTQRGKQLTKVRNAAAKAIQVAYRVSKQGESWKYQPEFRRALWEFFTTKQNSRESMLEMSDILVYTHERLHIGIGDLQLKLTTIANEQQLLQVASTLQRANQMNALIKELSHTYDQILR